MKRQNGVTLNGKLIDVRASQVTVGDPSTGSEPALNTVKGQVPSTGSPQRARDFAGQVLTGRYVAATLVTDHLAYGGHHQVIFPEEHAADVLAYWALTEGNLEVAIEGWLRSTPATASGPAAAVVVVDRVIYLSVTDAMRDEVARYKAAARQGSCKAAVGRPSVGRK
jgi:hypothetical protein